MALSEPTPFQADATPSLMARVYGGLGLGRKQRWDDGDDYTGDVGLESLCIIGSARRPDDIDQAAHRPPKTGFGVAQADERGSGDTTAADLERLYLAARAAGVTILSEI